MISDVIDLAKKLISFNTVNPPGNEAKIALYIGKLLKNNGFEVEYSIFEENRLHLIARKGISDLMAPVVFSGHLDTVPLGSKTWKFDPFSGTVSEGRLYGRGASDMKGALAAMITASILAFEEGNPPVGICLILSAGEELGCQGIRQFAKTYQGFSEASALIVGEPTANLPIAGHKGGLYLKVSTTGVTAHSSMPKLGVNAIYKVAKAITKIENLKLNVKEDLLLGFPTINVGTVNGGMNINSVPDYAEFTIDIRTTGQITHDVILAKIKEELGEDFSIDVLADLNPVLTGMDDSFIKSVYDSCGYNPKVSGFQKGLPYLTDASVLQALFKGVPTVILGPGQPELAHKTDEFCYVEKIDEAVNIYRNIILKRSFNK